MRRVWPALLGLLLAGAAPAAAEDPAVRALPVPAATIYPGQVVGAAQITERNFQTTARSLQGVALAASDIVGKEARRRLTAGRPVPLSALSEPLAIRRGGMARLVYREDGFSISAAVVALADGVAGDVIDARNPETGVIIKVTVLGSGDVAVAE